jgi:hypothetical protein
MTVNPTREYRKILAVCVLLILIVWIGHVTGCSAAGEQAKPVVEPAPLAFSGQLEFADGSVVELHTGQFLSGGDGKAVRRMDFDLSGGVLADGQPQMMTVEYRSTLHGEWVRCGRVAFDVLGCTVSFALALQGECAPEPMGVACRPFQLRAAEPAVDGG